MDAAIVILDHLDNIREISRWDLWKRPEPVPAPDLPFVLEESSTKGMQMVARRSIQQGELIALERPLVVSRTDIAIAEDQSTTGVFYRAALSGLSAEKRRTFLSLCNSFGSEEERLVGILNTNCCTIPLAPSPSGIPTAYSGLFPTLCRANHDCAPNANFFFNPQSFTGQFHAVRPIAKGEEITVLYSELAASRQERRAELLQHYKFVCECKTCSLPPALAELSDTRRRAIGDLIPLMHQGTYADDMTIAHLDELLDWATIEGLYALYAELLVYGYGLAIKLDLHVQAQKWSRMAAAAFKILDGADSPRLN
ncbi:SET domain-containing protein [Mycena belliarum]|uniref:SET domain-containing protein n=1 Tax=Mycena belliarum TaxID=1033014 RepID=A0AAD6TT79_9AGAR|nr:SET domain-containing protein [Mycena belliae]